MLEFVTNRTGTHVDLRNRLSRKSWNNMTDSEQKTWYDAAAKGAYNYTDLNRVEKAVEIISNARGLRLTTKTDWTLWDVPTQADMERYLNNVRVIHDDYFIHDVYPLPTTMNNLTYEGANQIEVLLSTIYQKIFPIVLGYTSLGSGNLGGSSIMEKMCLDPYRGVLFSDDSTFSYVGYPVEPNTTYMVPYAIRYACFMNKGDYEDGSLRGATATETFTTSANATSMIVTFRYADISPSEVSFTKVG